MEPRVFKRFPAIRCFIKHLKESRYINEDRTFYTIFGKVKRVRFIATVIDKREIISEQVSNEDDFIDEDQNPNKRIEFDLDDGTGSIRAIIWQADIEKYEEFKKGVIVDIVGLLRYWKDYISISPEIMKKVNNPNLILLREIDVIRKIKNGAIEEIPQESAGEIRLDDFSESVDVDSLFEEDAIEEFDELKEKVYTLIEDASLDGSGISFKDIKLKLKVSDNNLKRHIRDLVMESRIYQSDEKVYQSY
ncbi:MAG: OB-fold nucleic acid binding domain-containing protein [Promethearchaeota archaeon]